LPDSQKVETDHKTPLLSALSERNISCAIRLMKMGIPLSERELFHYRIVKKPQLIDIALESGANPNQLSMTGVSLLQFALTRGNILAIKALLRHGATLRGGELAQAFKRGDHQIIQTLLEYGAIASPSPFQESFLESALCCGKTHVASLALQMDQTGYDGGALCAAVFCASRKTDYELVQLLLSRRPPNSPADSFESTAISIAVLYGSNSLVYDLTAVLPSVQLCKIPAKRGKGFHRRDYFKKMRWLNISDLRPLDQDGMPFWKSSSFITASPLLAAIHRGEKNLVLRLIEVGFQPDSVTISYPIWIGSNLISMLLESPTLTSLVDSTSAEDPAFWAIETGNVLALHLLKSTNQNIWVTRARGDWFDNYTILQHAVKKGNEEIVAILLQSGAPADEPAISYNGGTALQIAARKGYLAIAKRLIMHGAGVHTPSGSECGPTALEEAAKNGRLDMIQLLLNHCNRDNDDWKTNLLKASATAAMAGHYTIVSILKRETQWSNVEERKLKLMLQEQTLRVDWAVTTEGNDLG
jgi:ankyrin repeat protein